MAIAIQEYLGFKEHHMDWKETFTPFNIKESLADDDPMCANSIMVDIEGIHVGPTRNYTWYTEEALKTSIPTWTKPYLRPMIMHHNESDGKIIGRVKHVEYTDVNTKSGTGALVYTVNIPDKEGKEQVKDGRLKTVSIGVIVHDATCSICGQNIAQEEMCEHERGSVYENETCYWMIHKMEAKELSYVIVPSDIYAQNIRIYNPSNNINKSIQEGVLNLSESNKDAKDLEQKESNVIDEVVTDKENKVADVKDDKEKNDLNKLKTENNELKATILDNKSANKKATIQIEKLTKELEEVKVSLEEANEDLIVSKSDTIKQKQLKEAAESEIVEHKLAIKENLVQEVLTLREGLGKEGKAEEFSGRSPESLKDSITDLKEEMGLGMKNIAIPDNPGLSVEEDIEKNVDKEKSNSNISLAEGLEDLFSGIVSSHTK